MAETRTEVRRAQLWLGTLVEISAQADTDALARAAVAAAFRVIARIHRSMSLHDPQSELSRLNAGAYHAYRPISPDLRAVLRCALDLAARSDGAFDPTVGGRVAALGFLPPQARCDRDVSWRDVRLSSRGVRFARPLALDFGGIAKGYAVDCAIESLRLRGMTAARVNAGGDLRVFGAHSERVHVRTGGPQGIVVPLLSLTDGAVATSAYGGQRRRVDGRWATPLIDPRRGVAVMSTRTVCVVAPTCMLADALTKVVTLRGEAASKSLRAYNASALLLSPAAGRWRCTALPATPTPGRRSARRIRISAALPAPG